MKNQPIKNLSLQCVGIDYSVEKMMYFVHAVRRGDGSSELQNFSYPGTQLTNTIAVFVIIIMIMPQLGPVPHVRKNLPPPLAAVLVILNTTSLIHSC
jgi:hypothetical protein